MSDHAPRWYAAPTLLAVVSLTALTSYWLTLAPSITWQHFGADSGDLAAAVAVGGVPHPPGYPTYLLLGELFRRLPLGEVAYRLNLLSAVSAALAAGVMALLSYHTLPGHRRRAWWSALAAALLLAFAPLTWSQAVITETYALNALLAALLLYGSVRVTAANQGWALPALAGLLGVSLGNHLSILLLLPAVLLNLRVERRGRHLGLAVGALGLGLLVYLLIPLRAQTLPPVNWGLATDWPNFGWLVTAQLYRPFLFGLPPEFIGVRLVAAGQLLAAAWLGVGLPVAALGWGWLAQTQRRLAGGSLLSFLLVTAYAIGYNTTDSLVYLLPALMLAALWLAWGLNGLGALAQASSRPRAGRLLWAGLLCLPLLAWSLNFPAMAGQPHDAARHYLDHTLATAPPQAIILTASDAHTFALWYGRYALGRRPDVTIIHQNLLPYAWYRTTLQPEIHLAAPADRAAHPPAALVTESAPGRPLFLADPHTGRLTRYPASPAAHLPAP